ncbi:MAG TPA: hypothetical protein VMR95_01625 [Candidatus Binatia bacterium]|nr:hypothetical protein [Candidatus Binatia bacterium]
MPPYFFRTGTTNEARRILAKSPEGSTKVYDRIETQDWMRGAMNDNGEEALTPISRASIDFLANEAVEAVLTGGVLMHVEADSREALQALAETAEVDIQPLN